MGMIIADQSPSRINQGAIRNTSVKIIHETGDRKDMESVSFALDLSEFQTRSLPVLHTGQALVKLPNGHATSRVIVQRSEAHVKNVSCIFCQNREFCCYERVKSKIRMDADTMLLTERLLSSMLTYTRLKKWLKTLQGKTNWRHMRFFVGWGTY